MTAEYAIEDCAGIENSPAGLASGLSGCARCALSASACRTVQKARIGGDRDRHRSGLCDDRLRDAGRRSDGLARRAAPANAAGQQPLGARYAHGGITMERFALRKPWRNAAQRHRRVHGVRQVVTHAEDRRRAPAFGRPRFPKPAQSRAGGGCSGCPSPMSCARHAGWVTRSVVTG